MQTYGQWYTSVWLAKSTLNEREAKEVITRWGEHLSSSTVNQKVMYLFIYLFIYLYFVVDYFLQKKALLVYLSLGQFFKVTEMLYR